VTKQCPAPKLPSDAKQQQLSNKYPIGARVRIDCANGDDYKYTTCQTSGDWTPLKYVCGSKFVSTFSIAEC